MTNKQVLLSYFTNKRFVLSNLLFWIVLYVLLMTLQFLGGREGDYRTLIRISVLLPVVILVFYINYFLCELFILKQKGKYIFYSIVSFCLFVGMLYVLKVNEIGVIQSNTSLRKQPAPISQVLGIAICYLVIILFSTLFWSVTYASKKTNENLAILLRLQGMENEKVLAEKQFLQSQINPHFLYNTLNFFYAKSLTHSAELAESILLLSNIMRYSLQQKENSSGMVFLDEEVEHIHNVIKINQFRFNNKLQIQFLIAGNSSKVRIVPLILITLVENAFKHGELLDAAYPVVITLEINEANQTINFTVRNKKSNGPKEMGTGIGLENTKRRLAFTYNGNHSLIIKDEPEFYTAVLELPLFKDM